MSERTALLDCYQEMVNQQAGIIEIIGVLATHLAERGAVDLTNLRKTLDARIAVWSAPTSDRPGGRNQHRADALKLFKAHLPEDDASDGKVN